VDELSGIARDPADAATDPPVAAGGAAEITAADTVTLARRGLISFVGAVAFGIFNFAWIVIIGRGWGARRAGQLFEGVALFTIAASIAVFGAEVGLVRSVAGASAKERAHELRRLLKVAIVPVILLSLAFAIAAPFVAEPLARAFDRDKGAAAVATYIRVLAPFLPFAALFYTTLAAARGLGKMVPTVALEKIGRAGGQTVTALAVILLGGGAIAMGLGWGLPFAIGAVASTIWCLLLFRRVERMGAMDLVPQPTGILAREFWRFAAPRGLASVFQAGLAWFDTLLVGALLSASAAGVYTASSRVLLVGSFFLLAIIQAIGPQISAMFTRGEPLRAQEVYRTASWWLIAVTWPMYLTMAVFAPAVVRLFGVDFARGAPVITIMCLAMLVSMALGPIDIVLLMGGKSSWNLINTVVALGVNILLNLLLIPHLGIAGAALAWAVSICLNNLMPAVQVQVMLGVNAFGRGGLIPSVASVICFAVVGLVVRWLVGASFVGLAVALIIGLPIYAAILWRSRDVLQLHALWNALQRRRGAAAERPA
jgi:O-antigen/teichoic acid export membrane protein